MIGKKRKLGKKIEELRVGDTYTTEKIVCDKDLLLYLGLTNDANPLYIQHDYASQTPYQQPIAPATMLFGMVSSIVSMHLPGPGSHIVKHSMSFPTPVFHESIIIITLEITAIHLKEHTVVVDVNAVDGDKNKVIHGQLEVRPAYPPKSITVSSLENFL